MYSLILAAIIGFVQPVDANWPEYRGPNFNGISTSKGLPVKWTETENIRWKAPIHGKGWSTPVVWGSQIWLTTATSDGLDMWVMCLDKNTGRILLDKKLFTNAHPDNIHDTNSYASPSPVIEEGRVFVHFGTYGTACIDTHNFTTLWQRRNLNCLHSVGPGSSPLLYKNSLILTFDGIDVQFIAGLNKATGETIWKTNRSTKWKDDGNPTSRANERRKNFCTPVVISDSGKPVLISPSASAVFGYDPSNGKELWALRHNGYSASARTIEHKGLLYFEIGFDSSELIVVKTGGVGDITDTHVAWKYTKNVPTKTCPIIVDDLVYLMNDSGILTCLDAVTGQDIYKERLGGHFSSSPIFADGRLYFSSEEGKTIVIKPGRKLEIIAENILADGFMASPIVAGNSLYLRSKAALYRVELQK